MRLLRLFPLFSLLLGAWAVEIYHGVRNLPSSTFDFIIAGGGLAGLVVANRLTENPRFNVLVIEAGLSHQGIKELQVPFLSTKLIGQPNPWDWNSTSVPQPGLNGRSASYPRGFVLGGSSSHNGMVWLRGSRDDYDRWARVTGDDGWSWNRMLPYQKKTEKWTPPTDGHDDKGQYEPNIHGFKGLLPVSVAPGYPSKTDDKVLKTSQELNSAFPFIKDPNDGRPIGVGWMQSSIGRGVRASSATAYYEPFAHRPNLHVLVDTTVTRLLAEPSRPKDFRKVEVVPTREGTKQVLTARKEVILSAGVIGTPTILLHSGIGDKDDLQRVGVKSTLNLPDVGKHFHNHAIIVVGWNMKNIEPNLDDPAFFSQAMSRWDRDHTGPLGDTGLHFSGGFRLPADSPIFSAHRDPSAGPNTPHCQLLTTSGNGYGLPGGTIGMFVSVVTPASRGSVTINSTNPLDPPVIDQGLLKSDFDVFVLREGYLKARQFFSATAWQGIVLDPVIGLPDNATVAEIDAFIRNSAIAASHAVGTASMSAVNAKTGVVNPDLRVKGAVGLRVVDASVLPYTIAANTQAAVYAVAERASDLIKEQWK